MMWAGLAPRPRGTHPLYADHIDLTAAEVARARALHVPPLLTAAALAAARRPRPAAELMARLEAQVERLAAQIARLGGRA